jgi:hypothetical protein
MQHNLAVTVQDTDVQGAGMEINATVKLMLLGVESHEVSSSPSVVFPSPSIPWGMRRRGPP